MPDDGHQVEALKHKPMNDSNNNFLVKFLALESARNWTNYCQIK